MDGFDEGIERIAVVTTECEPSLDCARVEEKVRLELVKMASGFAVAQENQVREYLFGEGHLHYTSDLREALAEQFELDAILEVSIPHAVKGDGFGGQDSSEARVEILLVKPTWQILLHGVGTGRPNNVVTAPERVAGNVIEKIFEKAFGG